MSRHVVEALARVGRAEDVETSDPAVVAATQAVAFATLELAKQQRIANQIRFAEATGGMWSELRQQISEELGL